MDDHGSSRWSEGISPVIFAINTRSTCTTKKSPYEMVFGQDPLIHVQSGVQSEDHSSDDTFLDQGVNSDVLRKEAMCHQRITTDDHFDNGQFSLFILKDACQCIFV